MKRSSVCYATTHPDGKFYSFMYGPQVASLFGLRETDVFQVCVRELNEGETSEYWAWWSTERKEFSPSQIWPHKGLVEMCFPYGSKAEVERGRGEVVNVVVEKCADEAG